VYNHFATRYVPPVVISVLIVNYQAYTELKACLGSVEPFLGTDVELVLVDHAPDLSAMAALRARFPWAHVVEVNDNPGFAAGVNLGARNATGRYLLLLNPDCVLVDDVMHGLARWLDEHESVGVCGARVHETDGSVQQSARRFPGVSSGFAGRTTWLTKAWPTNPWTRRNLVAHPDARDPAAVDWVSGACMMVRRRAFDDVGGLDERFFLYWEDADLCRRLKLKGWSTFYHPRFGVTHLTGRSSVRAQTRSAVAFHNSAFTYFWRHSNGVARLTSPFVYLALQLRLALKLLQLHVGRQHPR